MSATANPRVDYDRIAPTYDRRYDDPEGEGAAGIVGLLSAVMAERRPSSLLEVGCGSGYWLSEMCRTVPGVHGLDFSRGMLGKARERRQAFTLTRGTASCLPFRPGAFGVIFCVNALHHFDDPRRFVGEAARCLDREGTLVAIGMSPGTRRDRWYLYDYFPGTYETDVGRYPSPGSVTDWVLSAGFEVVESREAHRIRHDWVGRAVLGDPTLQKNGTSQLVLLSDEAYAAGRRRIDRALESDEATVFPVDISLVAVLGKKKGKRKTGSDNIFVDEKVV